MKTIGIYYGSSTGVTEDMANLIADLLGVAAADVHDVAMADVTSVDDYEVLLLGSSTWGGYLQYDWEDFLPMLAGEDLTGKAVGFFGCGDSLSFGYTFCDALGILKEELADTACVFIGEIPSEDYDYEGSRAEEEYGILIGCLIDEINESDKTEDRITAWLEVISLSL